MNMWLDYLKECLFEEIDVVLCLLGVDKKVQGESNDVNKIIDFINDNIDDLQFYDIDKEDVLLDGSPVDLIKVLNDLVEKKNRVIVLKNNYAINKWIVERYKEFLEDNGSKYSIKLEFSDSYKITNKVLIIGSEDFVNEMDTCLEVEKIKIINN